MSARFRRGTCPGLSEPMLTGDGLLVRLTTTGATIACEAFAALCAAARGHGNGVVEITSRGSIQIRGLSENSAQRFAAAVATIDMQISGGVPVLCDPLAGLDAGEVLDACSIAAKMRDAIAGMAVAGALGPKVSVAVDGGGALHLDAIAADVRFCAATAGGGQVLFDVGVGGDAATATPIGCVEPEQVATAALLLLELIAARGHEARAREIAIAEGPIVFRRVLGNILLDRRPPTVRPRADPVGIHPLRDGRVAVGFGLAFGHADSIALESLALAGRQAGAASVRTAPDRTLLLIGVAPERVLRLADVAGQLGFVVRADDPRRRVMACAGAPICASAEIPARAIAPNLASIVAMAMDGGVTAHISGCAKGCACPRSLPLTIVGIDGRCGIVMNGSARDQPIAIVTLEALPRVLLRLAEAAETSRASDEGAGTTVAPFTREQILRLIDAQETAIA